MVTFGDLLRCRDDVMMPLQSHRSSCAVTSPWARTGLEDCRRPPSINCCAERSEMRVLHRPLLVRRPHRQHTPDGRERQPLGTTQVVDRSLESDVRSLPSSRERRRGRRRLSCGRGRRRNRGRNHEHRHRTVPHPSRRIVVGVSASGRTRNRIRASVHEDAVSAGLDAIERPHERSAIVQTGVIEAHTPLEWRARDLIARVVIDPKREE